jgi:hypothetical protein
MKSEVQVLPGPLKHPLSGGNAGPSSFERTYVRPAATQERAAAALGLPFSTYRRHLTQGVDRVVAWLWDREVYGTSEHR